MVESCPCHVCVTCVSHSCCFHEDLVVIPPLVLWREFGRGDKANAWRKSTKKAGKKFYHNSKNQNLHAFASLLHKLTTKH